MNNQQLNPDWMYLEQNAVGRVVLTKMDTDTPYMVLDELQSSLFQMQFSASPKTPKQIMGEHLLSANEFTLHLDELKATLTDKGILKKMANRNLIYKYAERLLVKTLPDGRISVLLDNEPDSMFAIDGLMTEVFDDLGSETLTLGQILEKHLNTFETSEHPELIKYISQFFDNLLEKGMISPS